MRLFLSDLDSKFLMSEKVHAVRSANRITIRKKFRNNPKEYDLVESRLAGSGIGMVGQIQNSHGQIVCMGELRNRGRVNDSISM